jgi:hypothetical protein
MFCRRNPAVTHRQGIQRSLSGTLTDHARTKTMRDSVGDLKVNVRCPECRRTFRERIRRIAHSDPIRCCSCGLEMRFRDVGHKHEKEDIVHYIRHVEERTRHPHFRRAPFI